jgi:hypothetical protein
MADYVTLSQIAAFSQEFGALSDAGGQTLLPTAASRLFDNLCEVPENFFAAAGSSFTARDYYGDGTAYLTVDPFTVLNTVNPVVIDPDTDVTYDLPDYIAIDNQLIVLDKTKQLNQLTAAFNNRFTGWHLGVKVTVSAKWGFTAIPADVQMAVIALAIVQWRTADPAFSVISSSESAYTKTASLAEVHQTTIEKYKRKYSRAALFA